MELAAGLALFHSHQKSRNNSNMSVTGDWQFIRIRGSTDLVLEIAHPPAPQQINF